jgi:hypothetical protein
MKKSQQMKKSQRTIKNRCLKMKSAKKSKRLNSKTPQTPYFIDFGFAQTPKKQTPLL